MKIEYLTKEKFVELSEIKTGECFETNLNVYIKTGSVGDDEVKCVNLLNGTIVVLPDFEFVKPVNAKIVIGEDE